eukprot:1586281-Pleurochrysis_carterae.AAC.1
MCVHRAGASTGLSPSGARKRVGRSGCARVLRRRTHRVITERRARVRRPLGLCVHHAGACTGSLPSGARKRVGRSGCACTAQ